MELAEMRHVLLTDGHLFLLIILSLGSCSEVKEHSCPACRTESDSLSRKDLLRGMFP